MWKRIFITIGLLILYLVLYFTPIIGVNYSVVGSFSRIIKLMASNTIFNMTSIRWLGIQPYVVAHIIITFLLLAKVIKQFKSYSPIYFLTIFFSILSGFIAASYIQSKLVYNNINLVLYTGRLFDLSTAILLTLGVILTIWIGNIITRKGIGNGISLIVFINIMFPYLVNLKRFFVLPFFSFIFLAIVISFFMLRKEKKIKIKYIEDKREYFLHIPFSYIGIVPAILANFITLFLVVLFNIISLIFSLPKLTTGTPGYWVVYGLLIIFFTYSWAASIFNPAGLAISIKSMGAFIPGKESEKEMTSYLNRIYIRISLFWGLFLTGLTLLPRILERLYHVQINFSGWNLFLITGICIGCYNHLKTCFIKPKMKEVDLLAHPMPALLWRDLLEHKGIKAYIQHKEIYGSLFGLWLGPLAEKSLLVDEQDYSKSKEILSKYFTLKNDKDI